jgi:hypothetical protein
LTEPIIHVADVHAVRALFEGRADAYQQKQAIGWILQEACQFSGICPADATDRQATIFEGRRTVGMLIRLMQLEATLDKATKLDAKLRPALTKPKEA